MDGDDCCFIDQAMGRCLKGGRFEITNPATPYESSYACDAHVIDMVQPGDIATSRHGPACTIKGE